MQGDSDAQVQRLISHAIFDPELAGQLLTRGVAQAGSPVWDKKLQTILARNVAAQDLNIQGQEN